MLLNQDQKRAAPHSSCPLLLMAGLTIAFAATFTHAAVQEAKIPAAKAMATTPAPASGDLVITPQCEGVSGAPQLIELRAGKSRFLQLSEPVSRLTLGNDGVAQARLVSPTSLYLVANGIGSTNMILQGKHHCTVYDIIVQFDPEPLQQMIRNVLPNEKGVTVRTAGDSLVLAGEVSNAMASKQIEEMAQAYAVRLARNLDALHEGKGSSGRINARNLVVNMMTVSAPQQVMLEVKVAEISKTVLDQFGINFSRAYALADGTAMRFLNGLFGGKGLSTGQITGTTGASVGLGGASASAIGNSLAGVTAPSGSASISGGTVTSTPIQAGKSATLFGIDAQKQDGLVKILAEPTVMAISGQEGSFLAGGKIFIPVAQSVNGIATYTLEEKEFGVSLRFRPTVLADGRIHLQVNPEVSELSTTGVTVSSAALGGTTILPAFTTRKAATTVQLLDGQSFAIGGLMKSNVTGSINAFPILGELPIIGALFRSTSFQEDRSELVFVITPRLVKPLPPDYPLPTDGYVPPTRGEVIFEGKLEHTPKVEEPSPAEGGFDTK